MRILICQLRNHGDIIRTFPLIQAIKAKYPKSFIGFTCLKEMEETTKLCNEIDEIILQKRLMPIENHFNCTRICDCEPLEEAVNKIKESKYDIFIDLHGVFQSSIIGLLSEIPTRLGRSKHTTKDGAYLAYNLIADIDRKDLNKMERHFIIANAYFKNLTPIVPNFKLAEEKKEVALIPGSSLKGILKRWDAEKYIELAEKLSKENLVNVLVGPEEKDLFAKFNKLKIENIKVREITSWREYCEVFEKCNFIVGNDSAALHISIWKGIPTFMICGPTPAKVNAVWKYGLGHGIESSEKCKCKDVWSGECNNQNICMKSISTEQVLSEIKEELKRIKDI